MYWAVISEGDDAPRFELPALVDGEHRRVGLEEYLGEDVIILAFYPGDFSPACDEESDLDELDLFTMQKDVSVLGISADSLYSHAAFATEYALHIPLLSDTRRRVAKQYGVTFEDDVGQALIERAVFVVDHDGEVQYAWSTQEMTELPDVDAIKDAIAETGGDDTAFARYRVGYAHYTEGRRAFTSAMGSYQNSEWMLSQSDFKRAQEEFEEAAEHFDSAVRFVEDADIAAYYERAEEKATALWQAAEWLTQSASEYSSGAGAEGQQLRDDAERPLATARDIGEPIDPDDWPPDFDADDGGESILPQDEDVDAELAVDIDEAADATDDSVASSVVDDAAVGAPAADQPTDGASAEGDGEDEIDDEELEEIEAELTANQPENPVGEEIEASPTSMVDAPPGVDDADEPDDGEIDDEIDEDDLAELEADMAASQSAAEAAAEDEGDGDGADDDERSDTDLQADSGDASETPSPDDAEVPPSGAGSLESAGDDGSDDPIGQRSDDGGGTNPFEAAASAGTTTTGGDDATADRAASVDDGDEGATADDDLGEPEGASDEDMAEIPSAEELDEPDGASDEDMAAIPTEDELDEEADDGAASTDERD